MTAINFALPLPAAGDNAILTFDFADLEKLQSKVGKGYFDLIMDGLNSDDTIIVRTCLEIGVKGGDPALALNAMAFNDLKNSIADALNRRLSGKIPNNA